MKYLKILLWFLFISTVMAMGVRFAFHQSQIAPPPPPEPAPIIEKNSVKDVEEVEASNDEKSTVELISKNVYRQDDKFNKTTLFMGPSCDVESIKHCQAVTLDDKKKHRFQSYSINGFYDSGQWMYVINIQIQSSASYNPKIEKALDISGESWPVNFKSKLESEGTNLFRASDADIYVSRTYLEKHANKGLELKFYGEQSIEINIPSVYLKGVLKGIIEK